MYYSIHFFLELNTPRGIQCTIQSIFLKKLNTHKGIQLSILPTFLFQIESLQGYSTFYCPHFLKKLNTIYDSMVLIFLPPTFLGWLCISKVYIEQWQIQSLRWCLKNHNCPSSKSTEAKYKGNKNISCTQLTVSLESMMTIKSQLCSLRILIQSNNDN